MTRCSMVLTTESNCDRVGNARRTALRRRDARSWYRCPRHARHQGIVHPDLTDYSRVARELSGYDACFFCLGVSSAGKSEAEYRRVTFDIAVAAARTLVEECPGMTFIFVSGAGTDGAGKSRTMWARVKGDAENAILALPFKGKYAFRPAFIQPGAGIKSRTAAYRIAYAILAPLFPVLEALFPRHVTTTERVGRAMLNVARHGFAKPVLENDDINAAADRDA